MRYLTVYRRNILGYGLVQPLRRLAGSDFVAAEGEALVRACIKQILGTRPGEVRWRPSFGSNIEPYRHRNATRGMAAQLSEMISTAIRLWEPRVKITECATQVDNNKVYVRVTWVVTASEEATDSNVVLGPISQEVAV